MFWETACFSYFFTGTTDYFFGVSIGVEAFGVYLGRGAVFFGSDGTVNADGVGASCFFGIAASVGFSLGFYSGFSFAFSYTIFWTFFTSRAFGGSSIFLISRTYTGVGGISTTTTSSSSSSSVDSTPVGCSFSSTSVGAFSVDSSKFTCSSLLSSTSTSSSYCRLTTAIFSGSSTASLLIFAFEDCTFEPLFLPAFYLFGLTFVSSASFFFSSGLALTFYCFFFFFMDCYSSSSSTTFLTGFRTILIGYLTSSSDLEGFATGIFLSSASFLGYYFLTALLAPGKLNILGLAGLFCLLTYAGMISIGAEVPPNSTVSSYLFMRMFSTSTKYSMKLTIRSMRYFLLRKVSDDPSSFGGGSYPYPKFLRCFFSSWETSASNFISSA